MGMNYNIANNFIALAKVTLQGSLTKEKHSTKEIVELVLSGVVSVLYVSWDGVAPLYLYSCSSHPLKFCSQFPSLPRNSNNNTP